MTMPECHKCATCKNEHSGCEDLDFSKMKVIKRMGNVKIVKCSEWKVKK
jgi:hypothetical protein